MKQDTEQLRRLFESRPNEIIPLTEIDELKIMQYGRAIHDLRHEIPPYNIENVYLGRTKEGKKKTGFIYHKLPEHQLRHT